MLPQMTISWDQACGPGLQRPVDNLLCSSAWAASRVAGAAPSSSLWHCCTADPACSAALSASLTRCGTHHIHQASQHQPAQLTDSSQQRMEATLCNKAHSPCGLVTKHILCSRIIVLALPVQNKQQFFSGNVDHTHYMLGSISDAWLGCCNDPLASS